MANEKLNIPKELAKNSLLLTMLHGVRIVLQKETNLKSIVISTNNRIKNDLELNKNVTYPYGWLEPSDAQVVKDQASTTAAKRYGYRYGVQNSTRNTTRVGHLFPVNLGFTLKYVDNEPQRMMEMVETFLILSSINQLTFDVKFSDSLILNTRIEIPDSSSFPIGDTSDYTKPGGMELSLALIIHTWAGVFRDAVSVFSATPTIGYLINKDQSSEVFKDGYVRQSNPSDEDIEVNNSTKTSFSDRGKT